MLRISTFVLMYCLFYSCQPRQSDISVAPVTISRGDITLTVDPVVGGRLASLTYQGVELLRTERDSANLHWGSIAWSSPQADWGWPPPTAFDTDTFELIQLGEHRILFEGKLDSASQLRMRKRYVLGPNSDIGLTYWLTYEGDKSISVGLWENTRLPYAGRFEFGKDSVRFWKGDLVLAEKDSTYVLHNDDRQKGPGKLFTSLKNGYVDWFYRGIRLRKHSVVTNHYRVAPGQAPLELFADPATGFTEMELHGDYRLLGPGESSNLRVKWELARTGEENATEADRR